MRKIRYRATRAAIVAVKLHRLRAYELAQRAGLDDTMLSRWIRGRRGLAPEDRRLIRLARLLGLRPEECVEEVNGPRQRRRASAALTPTT